MAVASKMNEIESKVKSIISLIESDGLMLVERSETIMRELFRVGLAQRVNLKPEQVRVHPLNRNGVGLDTAEVHELCQKLLGDESGAGISKKEIESNAVCFMLPPDGQDLEDAIKLNTALVDFADGKLAPWVENVVGYLSIAGSHFTAMCNAIDKCCHTDVEAIRTKANLIDKTTIFAKSPVMEELISDGWSWMVIHYEVARAFPSLIEILMEARQATGQVQHMETEHQILKKVAAEIMRIHSANGTVDRALLRKRALRSQPRCAPYVDSLIDFAERFLAGHPNLIEDVDNFVKACNYGDKICHSRFFEMLATADICGKHGATWLRIAVWKAQLSSSKMVNGICASITDADIKSLSSMADAVKEANDLMAAYRCMVKTTNLPNTVQATLLGVCDVRIVYTLLGKKEKNRVSFTNVKACCDKLISEVNEKLPADAVKLVSPWASGAAKNTDTNTNSAPSSSSSSSSAFLLRDAHGELIDPLAPFTLKGFVEGAFVKSAAGVFQIMKMDPQAVTLNDADGNEQDVELKELKDYSLYKPVEVVQVTQNKIMYDILLQTHAQHKLSAHGAARDNV